MYFFKRGGWQVQFLEADLKTSLPRKLTFTDPEKIREMARRGGLDWR
jgi:2-hydroxychromene-2-carboxylate isomerase